jgi:hypothetical protein
MDALGRSWLYYGIHAISENTVGLGVLIVFPEYEFETHLCHSSSLLTSPSGLPKDNGSSFKHFSDPLDMKRLLSDPVAFHAH